MRGSFILVLGGLVLEVLRNDPRIVDRLGRFLVIPVMTRWRDIGLAVVTPCESQALVIVLPQIGQMFHDLRVITDVVTGFAFQVPREVPQASVELLEDKSLSLDVTHELSDNFLGILLNHEKTLLDDLHLLLMTDKFLLLDEVNLIEVSRVVINAVEIVKSFQTFITAPEVKGLVVAPARQRDCRDSGSQRGDGENDCLGKHRGVTYKRGRGGETVAS
jgi:hypothetical protein